MAVRSRKPNIIMRDLKATIARTVNYDIKRLNTFIKRQTPYRSGYARRSWRITRNYIVGYSGTILENRASYIGILDRGRVYDGKAKRYTGSEQAPNGIIIPVVQKLTRVRRRI